MVLEIFASSHKDDNYPSTLNCKVTVKHIDEIEDLDAYIAQGPKFLFFRKRIDLQTLELTDATSSLPSAEEAIGTFLSSTPANNFVLEQAERHENHKFEFWFGGVLN